MVTCIRLLRVKNAVKCRFLSLFEHKGEGGMDRITVSAYSA